MPTKLTFEFVQNYFKEQDCELLDKIYVNSKTKMKYICKYKHQVEIRFSDFKNGVRCSKCSGTEKFTFEYVYNFFKEQKCELLETSYINANTPMKYICKCGEISSIKISPFKNGTRCRGCNGTKKLTFEFVHNYFKEHNCELLSTEYNGNRKLLNYKCSCGGVSDILFENFKRGVRCMSCSGKEKFTFEYIYNFFKEQKCELLEKQYEGANTSMKYICKCGETSSIRFSQFKSGIRCTLCGYDKISKTSLYYKDYELPSGKIIRIQGYEHLCMNELILDFDENDILSNRNDVPKITYTLKGKEYRYYPDFYIKSENKVIEVKSTWTYSKNLIKNILKALATRKLGYDFEFWIYDSVTKKYFRKIVI